MRKGLILFLTLSLVVILLPSALSMNHFRGEWNLFNLKDLTKEQEEDLVSLMVKQRLEIMRNQGKLRELMVDYQSLQKNWEADPKEAEEILTEIAKRKTHLFTLMQENREHLKEILTKEQLNDYKEMASPRIREDQKTHNHGRRRFSSSLEKPF